METLSPSLSTTFTTSSIAKKLPIQTSISSINIPVPINQSHTKLSLSSSQNFLFSCIHLSTRRKSTPTTLTATQFTSPSLFTSTTGENRHWIVLMEGSPEGVVSKPEIIDYYVKTLERVVGSEKDAKMFIYDASYNIHFGFCCDIDEEASHLAAFEGFGELVEVKIIMDKISKRSKGYAFIEYTTEESASAALKEMNGKIINGWMIAVDVAKTKPQKYSRGRPRMTA